MSSLPGLSPVPHGSAGATAEAPAQPEAAPRIESLDQFRGCLVFLMIAANLLAGYEVVPDWLKHSPSFGAIRPIDTGATLFLFTVGSSLGLAFERSRAARGVGATAWRFIRRDLVLIAFGVAGSLLGQRGITRDWEVLQCIGLASLVALPFVFLAPALQRVAGLFLILLFQAIGGLGYWHWLERHDVGGLGGIPGGLAWAGVILFASSLSGPLRSDWRRYRSSSVILGVVGIGAGWVLAWFQPMDKRLVTASYLAVTTGIAALAALAFALLARIPGFAFPPFKVLGVNALTLFMLHAVLVLAIQAVVPAGSPSATVALALLALYAACFGVAGFLYRGRLFIRL